MLPGASGSRWMPRKIAGIAMMTMDPYPGPRCPRLSDDHEPFSKARNRRSRGLRHHRDTPHARESRQAGHQPASSHALQRSHVTVRDQAVTVSRLTSKAHFLQSSAAALKGRDAVAHRGTGSATAASGWASPLNELGGTCRPAQRKKPAPNLTRQSLFIVGRYDYPTGSSSMDLSGHSRHFRQESP